MTHYNEPEVWKDIPGYEELYQISNKGQVKSLNYNKTKQHKILKQFKINSGYYKIRLLRGGKTFFVHRLVAEVFLIFDKENKNLDVDHINHDRGNNTVSNLQILSHRENVKKIINRKKVLPYGVYHSRSKLNPYRAMIGNKGKSINLGFFKTVEEASAAYQEALTKINNNELQNTKGL